MRRGVRGFVLAVVMIGTAGLAASAPAVAASGAVGAATSAICTGNVEVIDTDTGASYGYLSTFNSGDNYVTTTDPSRYLLVSFSQGSEQDITTLNGASAPNNHLDLQGGINGPTLATGSAAYAWITGGSVTAAGSPPSATGTSSSPGVPVNADSPIASAVWDTSSLTSLTATWINPNGQPAPSQLYFDPAGSYVGVAGDIAAFNMHFQEGAVAATLAFVGTCSPPCTTTITSPHSALILTSGTTCVVDTTINGSIIISQGASLDLENATVTGSISARGSGSVRLCGSTAGGAVTVTGSTGPVVIGDPTNGCPANVIHGSLTATGNAGGGTIDGNTITGSWSITANTPPIGATGNHH